MKCLRLVASLERGQRTSAGGSDCHWRRGKGDWSWSAPAISNPLPAKASPVKSMDMQVAAATIKLLESLGIDSGSLSQQADRQRGEGQTVMLVAIDGKAAGLIGVADPIKDSTAEAIRELHAEGIEIVMLTGDSQTTAKAVAGKLEIDQVHAEVLPEQKAEHHQAASGRGPHRGHGR